MFEGIFSPEKLLIVAAIGLILLGPKRLPQVGRSVGKWLGEFRRATGGVADELKAGLNDPAEVTPADTPGGPGGPPGAAPGSAGEPPAEPGTRPPATPQ